MHTNPQESQIMSCLGRLLLEMRRARREAQRERRQQAAARALAATDAAVAAARLPMRF
jgi:hypothetical protein